MSPDRGSDAEGAGGLDLGDELRDTVRALRAHVEYLMLGGAFGLPRAEKPVGPSLTEPPPSMAPTAFSLPDEERKSPQAGLGASPAPEGHREILANTAAAMPSERQQHHDAPQQPAVAAAVAATMDSVRTVPKTLCLEERQRRLNVLASSIAGCTKCTLHQTRTQTVFSRGNGSSGLCFVGEGPGFEEDQQGLPFVGAAGQLLDRMIAAMGLSRDEVYVCNIVKCRPPENRKPLPEEMKSCAPYLEEQLELLAPEVIVALGATATEGLLGGVAGGITRLRGTWKLYKGRIAVMPTFHPAYLLRAPSAKHVVWEDLQAVLRHMGRPVPVRGKSRQ
jgi:uracil-DNA glycosylase